MVDLGLSDAVRVESDPKFGIGLSGTGDVARRLGIGLEFVIAGVYSGSIDGRMRRDYGVIRIGTRAEWRPLGTHGKAPFLLLAGGWDNWLADGDSPGGDAFELDLFDNVGNGLGWSGGIGFDVIAPDAWRGRILLRYNWTPSVDAARDYVTFSVGIGR
jgi:hypothetical protein